MDFGTTNIHCINLDRRPDRWAEFQYETCKGKFVAQRKSAVDGRRLSEAELYALQREFAPQHKAMLRIDDWCGGDPKCVLACYLSHLQILRDFVQQGQHELVVIFEDDVRISRNAATQQAWNDVFRRELPKQKWDLLALDVGIDTNTNVRNPKTLWRPGGAPMLVAFERTNKFFLSHAYMATREGARKLLATALRQPRPYDHHLWGDTAGGIARNLIIVPTPFGTHKEHDSDIRAEK